MIQPTQCSIPGYTDSQCIIQTDVFVVDDDMSQFISEYSKENPQNNLVIKSDSNIMLAGVIQWNSSAKLSFISQQNITFTAPSYIETTGLLELKAGYENSLGEGKVIFEGNGCETFINATNAGKVKTYYNPIKNTDAISKYASLEDYGLYIKSNSLKAYMWINTPEDLRSVGCCLYGKYALANDIDLQGKEFTPIFGAYRHTKGLIPFSGELDGNNKVVKNLNISFTDSNDVGLFRFCAGTQISPAKIHDLSIIDSNVLGNMRVGTICGKAQYAKFDNITLHNVKTDGNYLCGLVTGTAVLSSFANIEIIKNDESAPYYMVGAALNSVFKVSKEYETHIAGEDLDTNEVNYECG